MERATALAADSTELFRQNGAMSTRLVLLAGLTLLPLAAKAADPAPILAAARQHAQAMVAGERGDPEITLAPVDTSRLPPCDTLQPFTPRGTRPYGKVHIGIRCLGPTPWSILVPAEIALTDSYLITRRPLPAGHSLTAEDLQVRRGNIARLPAGTLRTPEAAIGQTLRTASGAGLPLTSRQLTQPTLVRQGQTVRVLSVSSTFTASAEGKALSNAGENDPVRIKMPSGQIVSGVVARDGTVRLAH